MSQFNSSKFYPVTNYLRCSKADSITLTFSQIEELIGSHLCVSARKYPAYWHTSKAHMLPLAWEAAGYILNDLDMENETVTLYLQNFIRR